MSPSKLILMDVPKITVGLSLFKDERMWFNIGKKIFRAVRGSIIKAL